jgi:hypothetical protein
VAPTPVPPYEGDTARRIGAGVAYLKASNSVVLTDAGTRKIRLLSWLTDDDMTNLEKLYSVSEAQSKALNSTMR